ncbi:MAG: molybdopterin-dependent oxidoreductase [Peptococcaceae bacterium]|jgi:aldehyde oxidoreductase|nr:molybdopterin-dependent oxidoreductase [Peptococcaceae bacterium]
MSQTAQLNKIWLTVNGAKRMSVVNPETDSLADVLRRLGLTGVKVGCGTGVCGACSVIVNGDLARSCTRKMKNIEEYSEIITVEGIGTPTHLHPIQVALMTCGGVQCGFCTPGFVVSAYALLLKNPDPSRAEVREWFRRHRNICRCTGYKQIVDAVMLAAKVVRGELTVEDITYRPPEDGEYYGTAIPRPDALSKVTGLCDYGDDIALKMPGETLYAAIVQPKLAHHANILSIDTQEAEKMPGVFRVLTAKDITGPNELGGMTSHARSKCPAPSQPVLANKKIRRYGDVVALVLADTNAHARAAAQAVKVELEQLPEYLNYLDAVAPGAVSVQEGAPNQYGMQPVLKGDYQNIPETIAKSAHSVTGSFHSTREPHLSIEGDVIQSYYDTDGMLTIQCKSQLVTGNRFMMAGALGLDPFNIRIIQNPTGAAFGWAMSAASWALCAFATVATGRPVSLSFSWEEFQHFSGKRAPSYSNATMACDEKGKITAFQYDQGVDIGPYAGFGEGLMQRMAIYCGWPYNIPNIVGLNREAFTNHNYEITYRGYGGPQTFTCSESMMDMLAEKAGIDPLEFRYINAARPGDLNMNSRPFREISAVELLDKARPLYEAALARAKAADTPEKRRGVGISFGGYNCSTGRMDSAGVRLELLPDDSVAVYNTWEEMGQGGDVGNLTLTLTALKELKLTPDQVHIRTNDTKTCPDSGPAAGSRSHMMNGNAIVRAAAMMLDARRKEEGGFRSYDEMKAADLATTFETRYDNSAHDDLDDLDPNTGEGSPLPTFMYCLNLAEVEVDTQSGQVKCLGIDCVCDIGVPGALNAVLGQGYGGLSHSVGFALSEDYDDVKKHSNLAGSGVPTAVDVPDRIDIHFLDHPRRLTPFGSAGCSEMFQSSGHVAILNAIYNACGVRVYELPAGPEKIKAGLAVVAAGGKTEPPEPYYMGSDFWDTVDDVIANPVAPRVMGGPPS